MTVDRSVQDELSKMIEERRLLESLKENRGYLILTAVIQDQVDQLQRSILFDPCSGVDSAWLQEYKKGQLEGKLSWGGALDTTIDSFNVSINHLKDVLDNDDSDDGPTDGNRAP